MERDCPYQNSLGNMRLVRHPVGYLINFGPIGKLEWKRFVLKEFVGQNR